MHVRMNVVAVLHKSDSHLVATAAVMISTASHDFEDAAVVTVW